MKRFDRTIMLLAYIWVGIWVCVIIPILLVARVGHYVVNKSNKTNWLNPSEWW